MTGDLSFPSRTIAAAITYLLKDAVAGFEPRPQSGLQSVISQETQDLSHTKLLSNHVPVAALNTHSDTQAEAAFHTTSFVSSEAARLEK